MNNLFMSDIQPTQPIPFSKKFWDNVRYISYKGVDYNPGAKKKIRNFKLQIRNAHHILSYEAMINIITTSTTLYMDNYHQITSVLCRSCIHY